MKKITFTLITACAILFAACGGSNTNNTEKNDSTKTTTDNSKAKDFTYPLPSPIEITTMIIEAGASYQFNITNPLENADKYFTEKSKALNLGVYGSDLSYYTTYKQANEIRKYLNTTKKLSEELEITNAFNEPIVQRVENNIENIDSLHNIVSESFYTTFDYLNNNNKGESSVLILAGGWIEGLYLATQLANFAPKRDVLMKGVVKQAVVLEKLITVMEAYKDKPEIQSVMGDLTKIKDAFAGVPADGILTDDQLKKISSVTESIRTAIVKAEEPKK